MDEVVEQTAVPADDARGRWYVIQTLSGQETKIRDNILRQISRDNQLPVYDAVVPEETVREIRRGKQVTLKRRIFPSYVLVRMDLYNEDDTINQAAWYLVRGINGVLGFVGGDDRPRPLTGEEYDMMVPRSSQGGNTPHLDLKFKIGDMVQVRDGAFMGYEGVVQSIDAEHGRLTVVISIFGRSTPVELEFWQVDLAV